jgi:hypothetical protein
LQSVIDVELEDGGWLERENKVVVAENSDDAHLDEESTQVFRDYLKEQFAAADTANDGNKKSALRIGLHRIANCSCCFQARWVWKSS